MSFSCAKYKAYDWFKKTWLASKLFFHGGKFQRFEVITVEGVVLAKENKATDGDCTFNICLNPDWPASPTMHCELTPCQSAELHAQAAALNAGDKVRITGNRLFDPLHLGHPAHWEIHPVTAIEVLK